MFSPYPLTTYHLLGAALYLFFFFFFIKEAVSRGFPIPPRVLLLRFGDEKSSESTGEVEGECWTIFLRERHSVREQGQSQSEAPHDTDTQISGEDYCPGSACAFAPSLQIRGRTLVSVSSHAQLLYIAHTDGQSRTCLSCTCTVMLQDKNVRNNVAQDLLSQAFAPSRHSHILTTHTHSTAQLR